MDENILYVGPLPASIGNLVNLENLKLTGNLLTGPIPSSIGSLSSLKFLNLGGNKFSGSIPQSLGQLGRLEELRIGGQEDVNTPDNLLASNKELGGTIPPGIGLPTRSLRVLRIRGTSVSGNIPESIGLNNKLRELYLDGNALTGSIPGSLGLLKKLLTLNLGSNQLSGSIPAELAKPKRKLSTLNLSNNQLSGTPKISRSNSFFFFMILLLFLSIMIYQRKNCKETNAFLSCPLHARSHPCNFLKLVPGNFGSVKQ